MNSLINAAMAAVARSERMNRDESMQKIMQNMAATIPNGVTAGKILILEQVSGSSCPLALFLDESGKTICAPIDPLAISFYEYEPGAGEDLIRQDANPPMREDFELRGPLQLAGSPAPGRNQISKDQLIAIQTLVGNNSTWWPVTDYSDDEITEIFGNLELNMVFFKKRPIGIAHLDYSGLGESGEVKIVFIGLDPAFHGIGMGRELLHRVMTDAVARGARKIFLDTVAHRDVRSKTGGNGADSQGQSATAHDVYLKAGFKIVNVKVIDPANKRQLLEEGLTINQLNGPREYIREDLAQLRVAVYSAFNTPMDDRF